MANKKHEIVIQDTCILLDLVDLSLLKEFFQLDLEVYTTIQVIDEILTEPHLSLIKSYLESDQLKIDKDGTFEAITKIFNEFAGLSFADSSVLEVAIRRDAVLFSADGSLRKISKRQKINVRGTLWVIENLYITKKIEKKTTIEKLNLYAEVNERAPKKEIIKLIQKLNENKK